MADLARLYDFTSGTAIASDQVDAEFNQLIARINALPAANTATGSTGLAAGLFQAHRTATQSIASGPNTKVEMNVEVIDVSGWYDAVTNFRYTPLLAGYYRFAMHLGVSGMTPGSGTAGVSLYKNGASIRNHTMIQVGTVASGGLTAIAEANGSTDYFECFATNLTGAAYNVGASQLSTYFEAEFIGRS